MSERISVDALGDRGLLVRFSDRPSRKLTGILAGLSKAVREVPGVVDSAPGHTTVVVEVDPARREEIARRLPELAITVRPVRGKLHEVPIRYDGEDLEWVCETTGVSREELAAMHSAKTYDVRMLGSPGFIYLSTVPKRIAVPRRDDPRTLVPPGSVGIGGRQTGIYGRARPGGWRLIGAVAEVPSVSAGDRIRFVPL